MNTVKEQEARLYWCAASRLGRLRTLNAPKKLLDEQAEELEAISMHTSWPRLKAACLATAAVVASVSEGVACALLA